MKKLFSIILVLAVCLTSTTSFATELSSAMQDALISVKDKIDIPAEADKFESSSYTHNDNTYFSFSWHDADHSISINTECDSRGRISSYYAHKNNEADSTRLSPVAKDRIFTYADAFMRKALPDLFTSESDCLVYNESKSSGRVNYNNTSYTFVYERMHNGIPVLGNNASIRVSAVGEDIMINNMHCTWYYDIEFDSTKDFGGDIVNEYFTKYPIEMVYNKKYSYRPLKISENPDESNPVLLIYRFRNGKYGYISASTGEIISPDAADNYGVVTEASADMAAGAMMKNTARLTEAELNELEQIQNLISREDAEKMLKSYSELKISSLSADSFSVNNNDGKYYVNISMNSAKEENSHYFYATLDGKTGEILNINNHIYSNDSKNPTPADYNKAYELAEGFIKKAAQEKFKECIAEEKEENDFSIQYTRVVNGVKFVDNRINASANVKDKYISSYSISWDEDVSSFADPKGAIGDEEACKIINTVAPIKEIYVLAKGRFVKCVAPDTSTNIHLDALTGKLIGENNNEAVTIAYSDIDGHWAESMIRALADVGIGLNTDTFSPDSAISQADFLRLMLGAFQSPEFYRSCEIEDLYDAADGIIPEDEKDENAEIRREDAFFYMIKFMNHEKIAAMDIFRRDFADSTGLSGDRLGAVALLTGFGVVKGDDGNIRAADSITKAETVAIIYNYLTKN